MLKKPPKYVVIELVDTTPGINPVKRGCVYTVWRRDGTKIQKSFQRFQLPLTPAFAFTDYKCQGRTLQKVVIDLAGDNTSHGTYVMLSRVRKLLIL